MNWSPPASQQGDAVRESRVSKLLTLEVSNGAGERHKIVVRNLSPHGIGARGDISLIACERLLVHLPNGQDIAATVRWIGKGTFGLALDERIEPDMLKPKSAMPMGAIQPRDAELGFQRLMHTGTTARSGFQRSHRDVVLSSSNWVGVSSSDK